MKRAIIILMVLFLLFVGTGSYIYYFYERPVQDIEMEFRNVNIIAFDEVSGKQIKTNYTIALNINESVYKTGKTLKNSFILEKVPVNSTIIVYNVNIEDQGYYSEYKTFDTSNPGPFRAEFNLVNPGTLTIRQDISLDGSGRMESALTCLGFCKNSHFCVEWSAHIISIKFDDDFEQVNKIDEFKDYHRCYKLKEILQDKTVSFNFDYLYFGEIRDSDEIRLIFYNNEDPNLGLIKDEFILKKY